MGRTSRLILAGLAVAAAAAARGPVVTSLRRPHQGPARVAGDHGVDIIVVETTPPTGAVRLLWLAGRQASPWNDRVLVEDGAGGVLGVTTSLAGTDASLVFGGVPVASVAAASDGSIWAVDGHGHVNQFAATGALLRTLSPTLRVSSVTVDPTTNAVWLVRSSASFTYRVPGERSPLFERLSPGDSAFRPVGVADVPEHSILVDLQNAGHIVVRGDTIWFAPFIRDEVIAMTAAGDTLWRTVRHLPHTTTEPRFELVDGHAVVDYHAVNMGLVFEPNGRLLVLSTPDGMPESGQLDELDPATGRVLATAALRSALPTLAASAEGRIYSVDPARVLAPDAGISTALPDFDLPVAGGGHLRSAQLRGAPTVMNFWATWCGPCRRELPAVDSLRRELAGAGVRVVGMNDDRDTVAARQFLLAVAPAFPTAFGMGRLQDQFGYLGLPWTVLVDHNGRVVRRWIGELSAQDLQQIRLTVGLQLRSSPSPMTQHGQANTSRYSPTTR